MSQDREATGFLNSRLYHSLDVFGSFLLLNLLWVALCLPLVTAFPATAAMFAMLRDWVRGRDAYSLGGFFRYMRANFAQSLIIGLVWALLAVILVTDFLVLRLLDASLRLPFGMLLAVGTLCCVFASVYLFPLMVNYDLGWRAIIKNSFFIAFGQLGTTLLCLVIIALAAIICYIVPLAALVVGSVTAYFIYLMCSRAFRRIEQMQGRS
jgi:uncharacterized membrane protein YesL